MSGNSMEVDVPDRLDGLPLLLFVVVWGCRWIRKERSFGLID